MQPAESAPPKITVVFGDSITEGLDLPLEERAFKWLSLVDLESQGKLRMINEGKGGRMTTALDEFDAMLDRNPEIDILVLAVGGADAARNLTSDCIPSALQNIRTMVLKARSIYGASLKLLLVGPTNIRKDTLGPTKPIGKEREANLQALFPAYAGLAQELGCDFITLYGSVPSESLAFDGVHPDKAGHRLIADIMLPKLLSLR